MIHVLGEKRKADDDQSLQSGDADPAEVKRIEDEMKALRQSLEVHRQGAHHSH